MLACFVAAYQVIQGNKPVGSLATLVVYWNQLSGPLEFFAGGFSSIGFDMAGAEELILLLRRQPTIVDRPGAKPLVLDRGVLDFENVLFLYDGKKDNFGKYQLPGATRPNSSSCGGDRMWQVNNF